MNNAEAKFILQGYRPSGADAGDEVFQEALGHARRDPALGEWFSRQQACDAALGAKLNEIQPPPGLHTAILAGARVSAAAGGSRQWWRNPAWLAAAASLAVVAAVGVALWPKQAAAFPEFAYDDATFGGIHGHGERGPATNKLQWVLSQPGTKLGHRLPIDFAAVRNSGCRSITYRGREVLEVCFNRNGEWFHCYIGRAEDFPEIAREAPPRVESRGGGGVAMWADAEQVVVVVSKTGRKSLEALL